MMPGEVGHRVCQTAVYLSSLKRKRKEAKGLAVLTVKKPEQLPLRAALKRPFQRRAASYNLNSSLADLMHDYVFQGVVNFRHLSNI